MSSKLAGRIPLTLVLAALAAATIVSACGDGGGDVRNGDGDDDNDTGGSANGDGDGDGDGLGGAGGGGGQACDCESEQSCVDGDCVDWVCLPDERSCSGNAVRLCAADGLSSVEDEACGDGHYCDASSAECVEGVCAPYEPACDGNRARTCNPAGTGYVPGGTPCDSDESCDAGECEPHVCTPAEQSCDGQQLRACAENGLSLSVTLCENQACVESGESASCEGVCEPNQTRCSGNGVQTCNASGAWGAAAECAGATPHCSAGSCGHPPSCESLAATCGPNGNESCCTSLPVTGGAFYRGTDTSYPATISSFRLDKYEVTVGRFRNFAAAWNDGYRPAPGAGKHTHLNNGAGLAATGGGNEPGWDTAWASSVDTSDTARSAGNTYSTWTSSAGANESLPITYVNWFESAAFCIWDGGFLASETEWEYAAAGGAEERIYPWGSAAPDCTYANFGNCEGAAPFSGRVGNRSPKGDGLWGQSDLAGNVREWTLDWYGTPHATCDDCSNVAVSSLRILRGGGWNDNAAGLTVVTSHLTAPTYRLTDMGLRCARTP